MTAPLSNRRSRTLVLVLFAVAVGIAAIATVFIVRAWGDSSFQHRVRETRQERGERV